jgi:hypothetical protein
VTWLILQGGRALFRGTYADALDYGERHQFIARSWHLDGTETGTRILDRSVMLLPEAMWVRRRRVAA